MREIPLTRGQVALVDDADYESLAAHKWFAHPGRHTFYAARNSPRPNRHTILMHHEIMGGKPPDGFEFDHINGAGFDNQRSNLRRVTNVQNHMNRNSPGGSSSFKGVGWHKAAKKWQAGIRIDSKRKYLGLFTLEEDAARAYDAAALEHFGEYARPNFRS